MACDNHEISIDNFKSGEDISYSLIIIRGHVKGNECEKDIVLNPKKENLRFQIVNNKFKIITQLNMGENLIELKYCNSFFEFTLNFVQRLSEFYVLPLYIVCQGHNGSFQAPESEKCDTSNACQRITLGSRLLQSIIAEKLFEEGLNRKTFKLEDSCQIFHSQLDYQKARKMSQEDLWSTLGREIANSKFSAGDKRKFLAFLSCTRYHGEHFEEGTYKTHEDILKLTEAYVALGGGGLALFGSACLFTWPEDVAQITTRFQDNTPIDKTRFMDDSCYRGTYGACFSTTLGSVLHELCHTFDLGHTEKGVMGRGFDEVSRVFLCNSHEINTVKIKEIEFKEKLDSQVLLSERLENKKKGFSCSVKYEEDDILWTRSCLIILAYHKFLNDFKDCDNAIKFDPITKFVSSTKGLRVIEIRDEKNGLVLQNWIFQARVLRFSFQIPEDSFPATAHLFLVVVEDNVGNILKQIVENNK